MFIAILLIALYITNIYFAYAAGVFRQSGNTWKSMGRWLEYLKGQEKIDLSEAIDVLYDEVEKGQPDKMFFNPFKK